VTLWWLMQISKESMLIIRHIQTRRNSIGNCKRSAITEADTGSKTALDSSKRSRWL
jgi:hypothetical protein